MPLPKLTYWVAVTDGAGYGVYSCTRLGGQMDKIAEGVAPEAKKQTSELGTDRPGRMQASPAQARHAFENKADWHEQAGKELARKLALFLNAKAEAKAFDKLVVIAPPKTLGDIRANLDIKKLGDNFRDCAKDLMNLSENELIAYLDKHF